MLPLTHHDVAANFFRAVIIKCDVVTSASHYAQNNFQFNYAQMF